MYICFSLFFDEFTRHFAYNGHSRQTTSSGGKRYTASTHRTTLATCQKIPEWICCNPNPIKAITMADHSVARAMFRDLYCFPSVTLVSQAT